MALIQGTNGNDSDISNPSCNDTVYLTAGNRFKKLDRIAILIALFGIVGLTYPDIAAPASNDRICKNAIKQELEQANYGSEAANKPLIKKTIVLVAQKDVIDIVKLSNRGELNSFEDRQNEIKERLKQKKVFSFVEDFDEVSSQAADKIEPLLENECREVK